jgi:hypothetical protein
MKLNLEYSLNMRNYITKTKARVIANLYRDIAKDCAKQAVKLRGRDNVSSMLRIQYLEDLQKDLQEQIEALGRVVEREILDGTLRSAQAVVTDNTNFLKDIGFKITSAFSHVPTDIINNIKAGKLYDKKWYLSEAVWNDVKKKQNDLATIVAKGIAGNKSSYDIAKDLEKYVDPGAYKPWDWSKVYPGTSKVVDYNCQRLSRTMTAHGYQQALVLTTKDNPFVDGIQWRSALAHNRTCDICRERNGKVYKQTELPPDHPNGLCTYLTVISKSMDEVADEIADWYLGKPNPALDKFAVAMRAR